MKSQTSGEVSGPGITLLEQMQIARRIEEVCSEEMLAEFGGESFGDAGERNPAGVGGEDGAGLARLDYLVEQTALDFKVLSDGFEDPIAIFDLAQVIVEVTGGDERFGFGCKECGGLLFQNGVQPREGRGIAIGLIGNNDIEQ